jgi:hypothetical protein
MSLDTTFNPNPTFANDSMMMSAFYGHYSGNMFEAGQSPYIQAASSNLELTNPNLSDVLSGGLYPISQVAGLASQAPLGAINLSSNGVGGFVPGDSFIGLDYNANINPIAISANSSMGENGLSTASYTVQGGYMNYGPIYASAGIDIVNIARSVGLDPNIAVQMDPNTLASVINGQARFNISSSVSNRDFVVYGGANVFPPAWGYAAGNPYPSAYPFPLQGSSNWNSFPNTGLQRSVNPWA